MSKEIDELLRGVVETLQVDELEKHLASGKSPVIKAGFDPTTADLHLGHVVLLNKLRTFQDMGHVVKFVVGDFTGTIGDPSGRDVTRPPMLKEELRQNANSYAEQAFKVLDRGATEVLFNSDWLEKLLLADVLHLSAQHTVARMLERDDFSQRYAARQTIGLHEFLYPLMQGYDSVVLSCDVEIGGTDQKFNLLVGRHLQKVWKQQPQVVMMMPILVGLDGKRKMSKSLDNYVGITEEPSSMYGKLMSLSDESMWSYFELLSRFSVKEINDLKVSLAEGGNPRDVKMVLARELVAYFHSRAKAQNAEADFIARFRHNQIPDEIELRELIIEGSSLPLFTVLKMSSLTASSTEASKHLSLIHISEPTRPY